MTSNHVVGSRQDWWALKLFPNDVEVPNVTEVGSRQVGTGFDSSIVVGSRQFGMKLLSNDEEVPNII